MAHAGLHFLVPYKFFDFCNCSDTTSCIAIHHCVLIQSVKQPSIASTMQASSVMRSSGLVSTSRHIVNRSSFQKSPAPVALRQHNTSIIRAEANNTGGSKGGSITNSGKTEQPDSYEVDIGAACRLELGVYMVHVNRGHSVCISFRCKFVCCVLCTMICSL